MLSYDPASYRLAGRTRLQLWAFAFGGLGLALAGLGFLQDRQQFFFSWLVAFTFWVSIALGGLFFTMLHHLVGARWSVVLRRIGEHTMGLLPLMAVLAIPLLLGTHDLYHWSHADAVAEDALLQGKSPYLNTTFFALRTVGYFIVWLVLHRLLFSASLQQDRQHTESFTQRMRRLSAPGMILFALTITFAAFDWLMSLEAHWYSTIFGVYVFSGAVLGMLGFVTLVVLGLHRRQILTGVITSEHYHDLGKLLFAFIIFWAYMAFSQYLLIWYGNIPEETIWFLQRGEGTWLAVSLLIVIGHFAVPFLVLFPQPTKRNPRVLAAMSIWILLVHWVDLYWIVVPTLHPAGVHLSWLDAACTIGIGGLFIGLFLRRLVAHPLVPINDPLLPASIQSVSP